MTTYKLNPPADVPSYVVSSVQARCNQALANALNPEFSQDTIRYQRRQAERQELGALRDHYDGKSTGTHPAWLSWGYRTIVEAWEQAESLAAVRDALAGPDFSHMTSGHPVMPDCYHVYRQDPKSPSGCILVASCSKDVQGIEQIVKGRTAYAGGERGEMSARAAMRGR